MRYVIQYGRDGFKERGKRILKAARVLREGEPFLVCTDIFLLQSFTNL